jgi:hypothetical protein
MANFQEISQDRRNSIFMFDKANWAILNIFSFQNIYLVVRSQSHRTQTQRDQRNYKTAMAPKPEGQYVTSVFQNGLGTNRLEANHLKLQDQTKHIQLIH